MTIETRIILLKEKEKSLFCTIMTLTDPYRRKGTTRTRVEEDSKRTRETMILACRLRAFSSFPVVCILLCLDFRRVELHNYWRQMTSIFLGVKMHSLVLNERILKKKGKLDRGSTLCAKAEFCMTWSVEIRKLGSFSSPVLLAVLNGGSGGENELGSTSFWWE